MSKFSLNYFYSKPTFTIADQQADGTDVPSAGDLSGAAPAVRGRVHPASVEGQELPREDVQDAVRRSGGVWGVLRVCMSQVHLPRGAPEAVDRGLRQGGHEVSDAGVHGWGPAAEDDPYHQEVGEVTRVS